MLICHWKLVEDDLWFQASVWLLITCRLPFPSTHIPSQTPSPWPPWWKSFGFVFSCLFARNSWCPDDGRTCSYSCPRGRQKHQLDATFLIMRTFGIYVLYIKDKAWLVTDVLCPPMTPFTSRPKPKSNSAITSSRPLLLFEDNHHPTSMTSCL